MGLTRGRPILKPTPPNTWYTLKEIEELIAELRKEGYTDNTMIQTNTFLGTSMVPVE